MIGKDCAKRQVVEINSFNFRFLDRAYNHCCSFTTKLQKVV